MLNTAQAAITQYHSQGGLNSKYLFSPSSGGWKSETRVPSTVGFSNGPSSRLQTANF